MLIISFFGLSSSLSFIHFIAISLTCISLLLFVYLLLRAVAPLPNNVLLFRHPVFVFCIIVTLQVCFCFYLQLGISFFLVIPPPPPPPPPCLSLLYPLSICLFHFPIFPFLHSQYFFFSPVLLSNFCNSCISSSSCIFMCSFSFCSSFWISSPIFLFLAFYFHFLLFFLF